MLSNTFLRQLEVTDAGTGRPNSGEAKLRLVTSRLILAKYRSSLRFFVDNEVDNLAKKSLAFNACRKLIQTTTDTEK